MMTSLNLHEAHDRLLEAAAPIRATEIVGIFDLVGRILAEPLIATRALPPYDNSAMDGYAVKLADAGKIVQITERVLAGDQPQRSVELGETIGIMTGAIVPRGTEAIVPFEKVETLTGAVKLPENIKPKQHIRFAGEEAAAGDQLIAAGERLNATHAALFASQGIMAAKVYCRLKVAVVSTGDELVEPWGSASLQQIHNTNSTAIALELRNAGYEPIYASLGSDDVNAIAGELKRLIGRVDFIITCGGISRGEADYTKEAFEQLGAVIFFHGLNFKPGRPTMAGQVRNTLFAALPGNPLSALANLHLLVFPVLQKIAGANEFWLDCQSAINGEEFNAKSDRDIAFLGRLEGGSFRIIDGGRYGSGMLTPLANANAFAIVSGAVSSVAQGAAIKVVGIGSRYTSTRQEFVNGQF
ncbi:molybdopterin molybdenumtransferase MoeA [Campylobacterota bacterium]|nr:molybdopterin molybdenumtransferase MoeA [Campylobacterota bacterium]